MSGENVPEKRILLYIPIVHTETDMGNLGGLVSKANLKKLGLLGWKQKRAQVSRVWTYIEEALARRMPRGRTIRLYQDSLPVCGREADIVRDLGGKGSRNHQLLLRLMEKGAVLMGTESAELLLEEYELAKMTIAEEVITPAAETESRQKVLSDLILKQRDRFIADRINNTLLAGETGILFIGVLHSLDELLAPDIRVERLFES